MSKKQNPMEMDYFILESDGANFEFKYIIVSKGQGHEDKHLGEYAIQKKTSKK